VRRSLDSAGRLGDNPTMIWLLSNAKVRAHRAGYRRRRLWGRSFDRTRKRSLRGRRIVILPGQYFDEETGSHYNYFRDYDPITGRYVESDPIGLRGGLNTYVYAGSNALRYSDRDGLLVGMAVSRLVGALLARSPEEISLVGRLLDVYLGYKASDLPDCVGEVDISVPRDLLRGYGGIQAVFLSTSTTYALYGAGAMASAGTLATASILLPLGLAGYGGAEIGNAFNHLYLDSRGTTIGSDFYDLLH
jgi:RHS repeat-associated protein